MGSQPLELDLQARFREAGTLLPLFAMAHGFIVSNFRKPRPLLT